MKPRHASASIVVGLTLLWAHAGWRTPAESIGGTRSFASTAPLIVGGVTTSEFPAVKRLFGMMGKYQTSCTGTFISNSVMLTAAHCIYDVSTHGIGRASDFHVFDRDDVWSYSAKSYKASALVIHPGYNGNSGTANDLALIVFKTLPYSWPSLPIANESTQAGDPVTLVGFAGENKKMTGTNSITKVTADLIQIKALNRGKRERSGLKDGEQVGAEHGDSGGPLLNTKGEVVGVVSFGLGLEGDVARWRLWAIRKLLLRDLKPGEYYTYYSRTDAATARDFIGKARAQGLDF